MIGKAPDPEGFIGQACSWCHRPVVSRAGMSLVCRPKEDAVVWRAYHSGCVDEHYEAEMSRLLGGR